MDSSKSHLNLLKKFSHTIWILQYYGYYPEAKKLMLLLCHSTHDHWRDHKEEYECSLEKDKKRVGKIDKYVNKEILDYIKKTELYKRSTFMLKFDSNKMVDEFDKFLDSVESEFLVLQIVIKSGFLQDGPFKYHNLQKVIKKHNLKNVFILEDTDQKYSGMLSQLFEVRKQILVMNGELMSKIESGKILKAEFWSFQHRQNKSKKSGFASGAGEKPKFGVKRLIDVELSQSIIDSVEKIIVKNYSLQMDIEIFSHHSKLDLFKDCKSIGFTHLNQNILDVLVKVGLERKALYPKLSFFYYGESDKKDYGMVINYATFYVACKDVVFQVKGRKLQLSLNNYKASDEFTIDDEFIKLSNFKDLSIHDVISFEQFDEDSKTESQWKNLASSAFLIQKMLISHLKVTIDNFCFFNTKSVPNVLNLLIKINLCIEDETRIGNLLDFTQKIINRDLFKAKTLRIEVQIEKSFLLDSTRDMDLQSLGSHYVVGQILSLPISSLVLQLTREPLIEASEHKIAELQRIVGEIDELEELYLILGLRGQVVMRNLDVPKTEQDKERIKEYMHEALYCENRNKIFGKIEKDHLVFEKPI